MPRKSEMKCYFGCTVDGPLHGFPKCEYPHEERFNSWKAVLSLKTQGYSNKYLINNVRFCYRHFEKYYQSPSHKLTRNAVPTLYLTLPQSLQEQALPTITATSSSDFPIEQHQDKLNNSAQEQACSSTTTTFPASNSDILLNVGESKEQWKNIRSVYKRHKKQALYGTAKRKPYYLEEATDFTLPFIKTLNTAGNASVSFEVVYDDQDEENSSNRIQSPENTEVTSPPSPQPNRLNQPKKRPNEDKLDQQEYSRSKTSRVQDNADTQMEANTQFLLSLLPDMNDMSSQQVRTFKRKVLELIDKVLVTNSTSNVKAEPLSEMTRVEDNVDTQREANTLFLLSLLPDMNDMSNHQPSGRSADG